MDTHSHLHNYFRSALKAGGRSEGGHRAEIGNVRVFPKFTYITQLFAVDLCLLLYWRVSH